ncbi:unnamed protein product [Rotaria magnacalcarata]
MLCKLFSVLLQNKTIEIIMNRQRPSSTMTSTELVQKCNTLVLRLAPSSTSSQNSDIARLMKDAQRRVLDRFRLLLRDYVDQSTQAIQADLYHDLEQADNREKFLEAFTLKLYHKANQIEEEIATQSLNPDEVERLKRVPGYERNNNGRDVHNNNPSYPRTDNYDRHNHYPGNERNNNGRDVHNNNPSYPRTGNYDQHNHYPGNEDRYNHYPATPHSHQNNPDSGHPSENHSNQHYRSSQSHNPNFR